jgi:poly(A) polymerase
VRLLRAVRFAAKLGFRIEAATEAPLRSWRLARGVPPARLFDEVLKLFLGGYAVPSYELLRRYGTSGSLFPAVDALLDSEAGEPYRALLLEACRTPTSASPRTSRSRRVPVQRAAVGAGAPQRAARLEEAGESPVQALLLAADEVGDAQQRYVAIPRRITTPMKEMMVMQLRLQKTKRPPCAGHARRIRASGRPTIFCACGPGWRRGPALGGILDGAAGMDEGARPGRGCGRRTSGRRTGGRRASPSEGPDGARSPAKPRRRRRPRRRKPGGGAA